MSETQSGKPEFPERGPPGVRIGQYVVAVAAAVMVAACIPVPATSTEAAEAIIQLQDDVTQVKYDMTLMQEHLDSLRRDLTYEDSLLRAFANLAGSPLPPRSTTMQFTP